LVPRRVTDLSTVRSFLAEAGVRPRKSLGQNFLVNPTVVDEIQEQVLRRHPRCVVEIGPGLGALTSAIADVVAAVVAVEIDRRLSKELSRRLQEATNVTVWTRDVLTVDFSTEFDSPVWVVGSLPYRITTPILKHLIDHRDSVQGASLITQWEVAQKICDSPGKSGSALGVFVQAYASVSGLRRIGRKSFFPVPEVDSAHWEMEFLEAPRFSAKEDVFFRVVRTLYRSRRKMVRRALKDLIAPDQIAEVLSCAEIDGTARGDTLSMKELDRLALALEERSKDM
jgi:16S rRNA (adenine1518-N6/adenine1519-N6)-dimethyltransferase